MPFYLSLPLAVPLNHLYRGEIEFQPVVYVTFPLPLYKLGLGLRRLVPRNLSPGRHHLWSPLYAIPPPLFRLPLPQCIPSEGLPFVPGAQRPSMLLSR